MTIKPRLLAALAAAIAALPCSIGVSAEPADPVAEALSKVRNVKADMFSTKSSVLGELPGPAELAAAQPDLRALLRSRGPAERTFTDAQRATYRRDYKHFTFAGRSREAECWPVGKTGIHARDIRERTEIIVVAIEPNSPAEGLVKVDDILIGANGRLFQDPMDPRPALGCALVDSATSRYGGKLTLQLLRAGEPMNVTVRVPVRGDYGPTWPDDCKRAEKMVADALACVKRYAPPASRLFDMHAGGGFWTPLFLMASGDDEAMEMCVRWAHAAAAGALNAGDDAELSEPGGSCWTLSYRLINLCEYYLLTGDALVLPSIRRHAAQLSLNQYPCGTWGHGVPSGYGPINNVGLMVFTGLILARECGVEVNPVVMTRAIRFFGKFCGTNFPYGEGTPGGRSGRMDNGMNSMAAVAFELLDEHDMAVRWARSVCYMWLARERGHAEGIFSWSWGPQGAALAPPVEYHMFMHNLEWYYELMNTRDGGFIFTRYGSAPGRGRFGYAAGITAAFGLPLYLPKHRLRTLGAPRGVFGTRPPADLAKAADDFEHKRWSDLLGALKAYLADPARPNREYAQGLLDAYSRQEHLVRFTLGEVRDNIAAGRLALAGEQLEGVRKLLGQQRPEMAKLKAQIDAALAKAGPAKPARRTDEKPMAQVRPTSTIFAPSSQGKSKADDWQWLIAPAGDRKIKSQPYQACVFATDGSARPGAWPDTSHKGIAWVEQAGPVKVASGQGVLIRRTFTVAAGQRTTGALCVQSTGVGEVYLNGYRLAEVNRGEIELRADAASLLKDGRNVLTARLVPGRGAVDVGLKISTRQATKR